MNAMWSFADCISSFWVFMILVKVSLLVGVVLLFCRFFRRLPATVRAALLALTLVSLPLIPLLSSALPGWNLPLVEFWPPPGLDPAPQAPEPVAPQKTAPTRLWLSGPLPAGDFSASGPSETKRSEPLKRNPPLVAGPAFEVLALLIWIAGVVLVSLRFLRGQIQVKGLVQKGAPLVDSESFEMMNHGRAELGIRRPVRLLGFEAGTMPSTWGVFRPVVMVPANWTEWSRERRRMILLHELEHVRRWDCFIQFLVDIACAMYWFLPHVWFAAGKLRQERERVCDERVLLSGVAPHQYARHLMEVLAMIRRNTPEMKASMAFSQSEKTMETRLHGILQGGSGLVRPSRRLTAIMTIAALIVGLSTWRPLSGAESEEEADANEVIEQETVERTAEVVLSLVENGQELSFHLKGEAALSLKPLRLVWLSPDGLLRLEETAENGRRILEFRADENGIPQGVLKKNGEDVPLDAKGLRWMVKQLKKLGQLPAETDGRGLFLLPREQEVIAVEVLAGPEEPTVGWMESHEHEGEEAEQQEDALELIVSPSDRQEISFRGEIKIEGDPPQISIDWNGDSRDLPAILNRQKTIVRRHLLDQGQELKQLQEKLRKEGVQFKLNLRNQLDELDSEEFQRFYEEQGRLLERLLDAQQEKFEALDSELDALTGRLKSKLDREAGRSLDTLRNLLERQDGLLRQLLEKELGGLEMLQEKLVPLLDDEEETQDGDMHRHQDTHQHDQMDSDDSDEGHGEIGHSDEAESLDEEELEEAAEGPGSHTE